MIHCKDLAHKKSDITVSHQDAQGHEMPAIKHTPKSMPWADMSKQNGISELDLFFFSFASAAYATVGLQSSEQSGAENTGQLDCLKKKKCQTASHRGQKSCFRSVGISIIWSLPQLPDSAFGKEVGDWSLS